MTWVVLGFAALIRCTVWCRRRQALKATPWLVVAIFCTAAAWT